MPVAKSHKEILADVRARTFKPVYFLHGEEPYYIDALVAAFESQALDEGTRGFNQHVLYGRDVDAGQVVDAASRYPVMASHQLVLVKEAQEMTTLPQLAGYLARPAPTTALVLAYRGRKLKANTKVYKAIVRAGVVFESKPLYANKVPAFVRQELGARNREAAPGVAATLAEYLGTDLGALAGALDKLVLNVPPGAVITAEHVEAHVGISRQFNVFEFQDALGGRHLARAVHIAYTLSQNEREHPLPMTVASLYGFFAAIFAIHDVLAGGDVAQKEATGVYSAFRLGKIREAARAWSKRQAANALTLLAEYDLKSKGVAYAAAGGGGQLTLELAQRLVGLAAADRR